MATTINAAEGMSVSGRGYLADQGFFTRYAICLSIFILFAFAQFAARGLVDIRTVPHIIHLHAAAMTAWLGLLVVQNMLVHRGELGIHRKLGWLSAALVAAIAVLGPAAGVTALAGKMTPPFFTPGFFLALTFIEAITFATMVAWAVAKRRDTQSHRRLMLGATFLLMEPALGRLLPMPLIGGHAGEALALLFQLGAVGIVARHDKKMLGKVHPATVAIAVILVAVHLTVELAGFTPQVQALAASIAGA